MRCNLVVALGDLAFRFPNLVEPWTAHLYQPLSDPAPGPVPGSFSTPAWIAKL